MSAAELKDLLQNGGPWGIVSLLLIVIGFLVRHILKMYEDKDTRQKEENERTFGMLEKKIDGENKHTQAFHELTRTVEKLIDKM